MHFFALGFNKKTIVEVFFDTLKYAVLLGVTRIFSYTYHYDIVMVDDDKGALDCFFALHSLH